MLDIVGTVLWLTAIALWTVVAMVVFAFAMTLRRNRRRAESGKDKPPPVVEKREDYVKNRHGHFKGYEQEQPSPLDIAHPVPEAGSTNAKAAHNHVDDELQAEPHKLSCDTERYPEGELEKADEVFGQPPSAEDIEQVPSLPPEKRGGRPRVPSRESEKAAVRAPKRYEPKPEVVCWRRGRQWIVAVEIAEEYFGQTEPVVLQEGSPLPRDEFKEECWPLNRANGHVVVRTDDNQDAADISVDLGKEDYLIFKLGSGNQGRHVRFPSSGSYLVVAPDTWQRDETVSGSAPVAPEPVVPTGLQAHFFVLEKDGVGTVAFRRPNGESVIIPSTGTSYELVGTQVHDGNQEMGPLFARMPPAIRAFREDTWNRVGTIIVGEEGRGKERWRCKALSPTLGKKDQTLPAAVASHGSGWYFVRIYDKSNWLMESLDFRLALALKDIRFPRPSPAPDLNGHKPARIDILHDAGSTVQPAHGLPDEVQVDRSEENTAITIPPNWACDETCWVFSDRSMQKVDITLVVQRLWWVLGEESDEPTEWGDKLLTVSRDDFAATSGKALWLRLPATPPWTKKVSVGFKEQSARGYAVLVSERTVAIPLRDFGDAQELDTPGTSEFCLSLSTQESSQTLPLCALAVRVHCKFCDYMTASQDDICPHIARAHVDDIFVPLTYEELRQHKPLLQLPVQIYKCSYCEKYVVARDGANPTSAMLDHEEKYHPNLRKRFRVISDVDEIRANVIESLPYIYKCKSCGDPVEDRTQMPTHVRECERNSFYECV
jgi:hypothetical protein